MSAAINETPAPQREVERVLEAAQDAMTDEMVGRLAATAGEAMDLMDQVNRSGLAKAIPALARLVNNGDLERLVQLARVYGAAQDALTDETVGRLSETVSEGLSLLDRFNRGGAVRLVTLLEQLESNGTLERVAMTLPKFLGRLDRLDLLLASLEEAARLKPRGSAGGLGGVWRILSDPETQDTLQFMLTVGKHLREHSAGGS